MNTFSKVLTGTLLALSISNAFAGTGVEHNTQAFLDVLNAGTGKPMEQMTPAEARAVLVGAQAGVKLTLPKADVSQKTIQVDGQPISLTIVRPAGRGQGRAAGVHVLPRRWLGAGGLPDPRAAGA